MLDLEKKYQFKLHSKLHQLLAEFCAETESCVVKITSARRNYIFWEVAYAFFYMVKIKELFDNQNPSIVILEGSWEQALKVKCFHIKDSSRWLKAHMEELFEFIPDSLLHKLLVSAVPAVFTEEVYAYPEVEVSAYLSGLFQEEGFAVELQTLEPPKPKKKKISPLPTLPLSWGDPLAIVPRAQRDYDTGEFNKEGRFLVKPDFLEFMRNVSNINPEQEVFQFTQIKRIFTRYLSQSKNLILDPRNNSVAFVEGTLLGAALGVRAFHRSQTYPLIASQLIETGTFSENSEFKTPLPPY